MGHTVCASEHEVLAPEHLVVSPVSEHWDAVQLVPEPVQWPVGPAKVQVLSDVGSR